MKYLSFFFAFFVTGLFFLFLSTRFIDTVVGDSILYFPELDNYSIVCIGHIFFIHSSIAEHLVASASWLL